ncbi:MAG TPA: TetR/AcrR family transcriptional regulator [Acidimicrobiales bacterium]|nr:TetR/AcrR family transcriptional regulator [Acidimicrobiales bacterium]
MAKPGQRSAIKGSKSSTAKRDHLVDAAFQTLRDEGFARASARAIASRGGFNSALIFYYFDSVNDLLVEALSRSSRAQLEKYEDMLANVTTLPDLVASVQSRIQDDMESGHVKVLTELIGATSSDEQLREAVFEQVEPWMEFTGRSVERILASSGLDGLVPPAQVSFVIVAVFLGMELLAHLTGDDEVVDGLFDSAYRLVGLLHTALKGGAAP